MSSGYKKVCLIGSGRAGMIHGMNFKNKVDGFKITSIVDPVEEVAKKSCKKLEISTHYKDYNQAFDQEEIDAIIVVSPTKFHSETVIEAAKRGIHIFCEKPMAMDVHECQSMVDAAKENNVVLQIGFMRRFDPSFVAAKEAVDAGKIGDVVLVKSLTRGPSSPRPWMYDIKKSNGPLAEVNSHDIDTLHWFTKSTFSEVYSIASNYRCKDAQTEFPDFYDNVVLTGKLKNGMQGNIDGAQGVGYGYDARVEILGTHGIIYIGNTNQNSMVCVSEDGYKSQPFMRSWTNLFEEAYINEDRHFAKCILEGNPPRVSGLDGLNAVKVVDAGNRSIASGKIVYL